MHHGFRLSEDGGSVLKPSLYSYSQTAVSFGSRGVIKATHLQWNQGLLLSACMPLVARGSAVKQPHRDRWPAQLLNARVTDPANAKKRQKQI